MTRLGSRSVALASKVAVFASAALLALSLGGAWRIDEVRGDRRDPSDATLAFGSVAAASHSDGTRGSGALASDPFSADRLLPEADVPDAPTADDASPPQPAVPMRLLGTVVRGDRGFAVCQLGNEPPQMVHVGERFGVLTLLGLQQGRAVFRAPDGSRIELSLSKPET